jgi:hypothetical protein
MHTSKVAREWLWATLEWLDAAISAPHVDRHPGDKVPYAELMEIIKVRLAEQPVPKKVTNGLPICRFMFENLTGPALLK